MRRTRRPLRGSVTQNTETVRMQPLSHLNLAARAGIAAGFLLLFGLLGLGGWRSGWFHRQAEHLTDGAMHLTRTLHFAVGDVVVEGRRHTDKDQLFAALGVTAGSPIFAFDPRKAEARIGNLLWVESATVERRLPDAVFVRLVEREPLARWQHDNHVTVIDAHGHPLPDADPGQFGHLALLVGEGAPAEAKSFLDTLRAFPTVEKNVTAAVRVSDRRWDLRLQPKIVARLPETDYAAALKRLSSLIAEQKILERGIVTIDLRIPDRLIIESGGAVSAPHPAKGGQTP